MNVDVLMPFVSLHHQPAHVPSFDSRGLEHILVVQVKALNPVEQGHDLLLALVLRQLSFVFLRRPVLKLEILSAGEQAHHTSPVFLSEAVDGVVNFEGHHF